MKWIQPIMMLTGLTLLASGCSTTAVGPTYSKPQLAIPTQWHAALPHAGSNAKLSEWWQQFDDPQVAALISQAVKESDTLAAALARIEQSRAAVTVSRASMLPNVSLGAGASRGDQGPAYPVASTALAHADASWELDLFGANARGREAALARYDSTVAGWHAAKVSLAAEVATQYVALRACEALLTGFEADAKSRGESDRLTQLKVKAGFSAPAEGALSSASVADAQSRVDSQRGECDIAIKSLVALTAQDEPALRTALKPGSAKLPAPAAFDVTVLPTVLVSQRADIELSEKDLAAASADIGVAEAARYPRVSLLGSIGAIATRALGMTSEGATWSFGPALDLPLFDAGRRAANADAARARYQEALANYKARTRNAVREVETALTQLHSADTRVADAQKAVNGYEAFVKATDARYRAGAGSLLELEDARRVLLAAQVNQLNVQRERVLSWISLYRALGGGWPADAASPLALSK